MVTAEITITRDQLLGISQPMQYAGIDWPTYEAISEELGESGSVRLAYKKGILTAMPITELHESIIRLLERLIGIVSLVCQTDILPTGSATIRSERRQIGVEPDLSYFVKNADIHRVKDYVQNEIELPPDIVVEIDINHRSDDKFGIYAELGVPEFWLYDGKMLVIYLLRENGRYEAVDHGKQLPILTAQILTDFLNRGQSETKGQFELLRDFQQWLLSNK